ncbi:uncharacterized protein LOC116413000 [Galleria mellonella]|uniref:Uncharacterized protein LOC116413000 n=1 Tax=Galleria mellonella TaxID=7137 RepID=A0A6J3C366_GALME|nr:uncharacterized protein LOC116413000 [Galleria mellonella]
MEYHGRRNRRGRRYSRVNPTAPFNAIISPQTSKPWSFLSGLYSLFVMTCLIAIIYLMLEYHCSICNKKYNFNHIHMSIDDISKNLTQMKNNYYDLETKISKFSQDLPKIEGQIEILEALANTIETSNLVWDPKMQFALPKIDITRYVVPSAEVVKNISKITEKEYKYPKKECKVSNKD